MAMRGMAVDEHAIQHVSQILVNNIGQMLNKPPFG